MKIGEGTTTRDSTRESVARLILERGPQSAAALAVQLELSAAAIRRHLDALLADGLITESRPRPTAQRRRGRPARTYTLTDAGRAAFPHGYDDLATTALRYLRETGGERAVVAFAEHRAETLARALTDDASVDTSAEARVEALAGALSVNGYAATTEIAATGAPGMRGVQICQHHCPVAHVAAEFPQLCEAETRAFEKVLGTYVQRLATIAHGDGVCTTHVPLPVTASQPSAAASGSR